MGQTDGRTPDRYITLTARHGQRNNISDLLGYYSVRTLLVYGRQVPSNG